MRDLVSQNNDPSSIIVISDTELEESEFTDKVNGKRTIKKKNGHKQNEGHINLNINSDFNFTKRKPSENDFISEISESFEWSELRILLAGDERVLNLNWREWPNFPEQDLCHIKHCNLELLCNLTEKHLYKDYDVVILVGFHYDFVCHNNIPNDNVDNNFVLDLKNDVNIMEILNTVNKFHSKWESQYPNTHFIWTLPSPPDFLKYNLFASRENNSDKTINKRVQNELTKNYYFLTKDFLKEWKIKNKSINIFPLSKVLFQKEHRYKKTFDGSGTPKFPRGYLNDGLYPTKMMAMYFAYLFIEFLLDNKLYSENKIGLDIKVAEKKLMEIEPLFKSYLHRSERSNGHSGRRSNLSSRHSSHGSLRLDGSVSARSSSYRSRSRSKSKSRHRRSRSRTRSGSRSRYRRSRTKFSSRRSHSTLGSESDFSERSSGSVAETKIKLIEKQRETEDSKKIPSNDEMDFFKTLRNLREKHEIECTLFRKEPHTHPMYSEEKEIFLKNLNSNSPLKFQLTKWEEYWKRRMEAIFEQAWEVKKDQLPADLNKNSVITSLVAGYPHDEENKDLTINANDGLQFGKDNVGTTNNMPDDATREDDSDGNSLCSDLDIDGLMENEDFLQGLDEIDKVLQAAVEVTQPSVPIEDKATVNLEAVHSTFSPSVSLPEDYAFIYNISQTTNSSAEEDLKLEFANVLKMIHRVSNQLGYIGLSVSALYDLVCGDSYMNRTCLSLISDSKSVFILVDKKLSRLLKENLSQVQKAIYGEIAERLQSLLKKFESFTCVS